MLAFTIGKNKGNSSFPHLTLNAQPSQPRPYTVDGLEAVALPARLVPRRHLGRDGRRPCSEHATAPAGGDNGPTATVAPRRSSGRLPVAGTRASRLDRYPPFLDVVTTGSGAAT